MKYIIMVIMPMLISVMAASQESGKKTLFEKDAVLEKLADGFSFTEGPVSDAEGNVYFTDQPNDRIVLWSTDGSITTFMQPSGRSNGLFIDKTGYLWACADEKNELWRIGPDKNIEIITRSYKGTRYNGPNDLWVSPAGGIYFTDPFYKRKWWAHSEMPQDKQCVYYLSPDYKSVTRLTDDLVQPNGIIGTADGKKLFVADIGAKKTWHYTINNDGTLSNKTLFCNMGSDGMTIDQKGNVYLTGDGVTIFNKEGSQVGHIKVPEKWTANVCFCERNRKSLFITASGSIYRIKMKVKGVY